MPDYNRLIQIIHQTDAKQNNINLFFDKQNVISPRLGTFKSRVFY
jgi:hypothetical protein